MKTILKKLAQENMDPEKAASFRVGDNVKVSLKIKEGDKERIQVFAGIVIARKGGGATETFTVRRLAFGEGVERTFCVHSPNVTKIEVESSSHTRRAKLYYLRQRTGKSARIKRARTTKPSAAKANASQEANTVAAE